MRSRLSRRPRGLVAAALAVLVPLASAKPYQRSLTNHCLGLASLVPRACDTYCGADNQFCCAQGQACTTLANNVVTCVAGAAGSLFGAYTTTWTETRTYTSTIMTHWMPAPLPTAGVDCVPPNAEQQACGPICCAGWQTCISRGQCSLKPGFVEPSTAVTSNGQVTTRYSAPFRVTCTTTITGVGQSPTATTSADGQALGTDGGTNGGGLSAGAIAGIVIGTLAGVALLLLLCFCCIARGLWNACCGSKRGGSNRTETVEERYVHSGSRVSSAYSRKDRHSGWHGGQRPVSAGGRRPKKSSGGLWLAISAAAASLLAFLNLKKDKKRRVPPRKVDTSRYSESTYTYSDMNTTPSGSSSSDRRTVYTVRTEDSRGGRSHYSRSMRRP